MRKLLCTLFIVICLCFTSACEVTFQNGVESYSCYYDSDCDWLYDYRDQGYWFCNEYYECEYDHYSCSDYYWGC
jgi:hypothetical protein